MSITSELMPYGPFSLGACFLKKLCEGIEVKGQQLSDITSPQVTTFTCFKQTVPFSGLFFV